MSGAAPAPTPAPIIVTALFGDADHAWFDAQRQRYFPSDRNHLSAHLTMFHHLPPSLADEVRHRLRQETRGCAPQARVAGVVSLGRGVAYRIESPDLVAIRERLADAWAGLLMPQDQAGWRPHVTVQNKVDPAEARRLKVDLEQRFAPRSVAIAGLACWWYRGGPWEALSRHMFAA